MKKLHSYMLKSFVGPFVATFFISMFVLIMQSVWLYIDDLVGKGLEMSVILQLFYYISLTLVPMGMPLAVLLASIMTFGGLGENYELTAMKSAGISLYRIMKPLIFLILILTVSAFYFSNNVLPMANLKARTLLMDIRKHSPELTFKKGVFINDIDKYSIFVADINKNETGMMYDMMIYNHTKISRNYEVTVADSGVMESNLTGDMMKVELYNGYTYTDEALQDLTKKPNFPFRTVKFGTQRFQIVMPGNELERSNEDDYKNHYAMLDIGQLQYSIDSIDQEIRPAKRKKTEDLLTHSYLKSTVRNHVQDSVYVLETKDELRGLDTLYRTMDIKEKKRIAEKAVQYAKDVQSSRDLRITDKENSIRRHKIEWHKKFTLSFACFIFFFIGAPLGAIIRKGGLGMPVIVSIFLFIVYYIIWMMGERSAREGALEPWQGMWLSSVILLPLGAFLTYTAMNDSAVLNADSYKILLRSVIDFFKRKKNKKENEA